jgi:hypothetical protein
MVLPASDALSAPNELQVEIFLPEDDGIGTRIETFGLVLPEGRTIKTIRVADHRVWAELCPIDGHEEYEQINGRFIKQDRNIVFWA